MAQLSTAFRVAPSRGTCRSLLMSGTLRVRTAEKTTLRRLRSLDVTRPESPASTAGLAHGRFTCSTLRLTALPHSELDTLWRNRCAGGAPLTWRHPSLLRQHRVSPLVASLATLDKSCATACHPSTRATLIAHSRPLALMYLRSRYAMSPMIGR